jgi:hypothetical protein
MKPLHPIKYNESLNIEVPQDKTLWSKSEIYQKLFSKKKHELKTNNLLFQFDVGFIDPEISVFLQLVDDNVFFKGKRRKNLLREDITECGITNFFMDKKNCAYLIFLY